mgnify:CR=1 FL=1
MQLHQANREGAGLGISMSWPERQKNVRPLDESTEQLANGHECQAEENTRRCQAKSKS